MVARTMKPGNIVEVCERGRRQRAIVDSTPEFGWVCVVGLPGRAGSVSVPLKNVRLNDKLETT